MRITNLSRADIHPDLRDLRFVRIDPHDAEALRTAVHDGDVLISITADIGIIGHVSERVPKPAFINQHIALVRWDPQLADSRFVSYFLASSGPQKVFRARTDAGAKAGMNLATVANIEFALPSRREQRAIAAALGDADSLIHALEELLAKKRQIKEGAMQELLTGKRRLPGFDLPWESAPLIELAQIRNGGTPSTSREEFWDGDIPWCTPTDITTLAGKKYLSSTARTITQAGLKASSAELLPVGSVVMTSRATIGACALSTAPLTTNQGFKNFIPRAGADTEFLFYLLRMQRQNFIALSAGSTFQEIGKKELERFEVTIPRLIQEQAAIANVLSDMDNETTAVEQKLEKARSLKQGMMQELLTGRIRLVDASPLEKAELVVGT